MKCASCGAETDRPRVCDECNRRVRERAVNPVDCGHCGGTGLKCDYECQACGGYGWRTGVKDVVLGRS